MYRIIEYTLFFFFLVFFQTFLFGNINLSVYISPLIYVGFIILLPMDVKPVTVLLLGLLMGVTLDLLTGSGGLHTISLLFVSFLRPYLLHFIVGSDEVKDGGVPIPGRIGNSKFFRYSGVVVFLHSLVFFTFESLSWEFDYFTLLRVLLSGIVTLLLVYFSHMFLPGSQNKKSRL